MGRSTRRKKSTVELSSGPYIILEIAIPVKVWEKLQEISDEYAITVEDIILRAIVKAVDEFKVEKPE